MSATGIAILGIRVARIDPIKSQMAPMTMATVISSVFSTSDTLLRMNEALSSTMTISRSLKRELSLSTVANTPLEILMVFDWAWRITPMPITLRPLRRV